MHRKILRHKQYQINDFQNTVLSTLADAMKVLRCKLMTSFNQSNVIAPNISVQPIIFRDCSCMLSLISFTQAQFNSDITLCFIPLLSGITLGHMHDKKACTVIIDVKDTIISLGKFCKTHMLISMH